MGLTPQQALTLMTQQLEQAGGSFKKLKKSTATPPALMQGPTAPTSQVMGTKPSSSRAVRVSGRGRRLSGARSVIEADAGQLVPQLDVQPLQSPEIEAAVI